MTDSLISMHGISKNYPIMKTGAGRLRTIGSLLLGRKASDFYPALQGIDLQLTRGESLGIVGENGAGKSTLLKIIAGVVKPTSGTLEVSGSIGALLELGNGFHPEYTGYDNIFLSAALMGLTKKEISTKLESIIEFADIGEYIDQPIKHYSSGMIVRLGFAVATAMKPDILITDEVLAVGDESFQKKCIAWIENYLNCGGTLLLCSHSMFHIQTLCQKALWIHKGLPRKFGDSFEVTHEYLSYHEEKTMLSEKKKLVPGSSHEYKIHDTWLENESGEKVQTLEMGDVLRICGVAFAPDDIPPVILFGIVRADGTPVYGTHSNEKPYQPNKIADLYFGFCAALTDLNLLPGKYTVRVHSLDPQGLRLFDTVEVGIRVTGETRDYGLCRLTHDWLPLDCEFNPPGKS